MSTDTSESPNSSSERPTPALPAPGEVWVSNELDFEGLRWRRIIDVRGGYVFYSVGGDTNRACLLRTFQVWQRKAKAHPEGVPA